MQTPIPPSADTLRALETAPSMFLILSPALYILTASNLYLEATQTKREVIVGRHIFEAFPDNPDLPDADGVKNINASLQEVLRTKKRHVMKFQRYDVPDHSTPGKFITRYWDPSHTPVLDENGEISYIVQLATNVTDLVMMGEQLAESESAQAESAQEVSTLSSKLDLAEQELLALNIILERQVGQRTVELKHSEENLQAAFDAAELGSCSLNLHTGQAEMSPRYRSLYGLPLTGEITWEMVTAAVEPEYLAEVNLAMQNAITQGSPVDSTYAIRHLQTGERRWMRVAGKVRPDSSGAFSHIYAVVMDVTIQQENEQRKNNFLSMLSHELKTPVTSIKGHVQLLSRILAGEAESAVASKMNWSLTRIDTLLEQLTGLIGDMLDLNRLDAGRMELNKEILSLDELVREVVEDFRLSNQQHVFHLNLTSDATVMVDKNRMSQVLINLIDNAIKYSPKHKQVDISTLKGSNEVQISIKDYGIGIDEKDQAKIFERFFRVEGQNEKHFSGFGIGLFLAHTIVVKHGGTITVESTLNKGAIFTVHLPTTPSDFAENKLD